jgi:hypothetical protein
VRPVDPVAPLGITPVPKPTDPAVAAPMLLAGLPTQ